MSDKRIAALAVIAAAFVLSAMPTVAQAQSDVFSLNYFDNIGAVEGNDSTVRITNPGTTGAPTLADKTAGDLCALIYVFRPDQQMAECCACKVTPNGLRTLSVRNDLTSNPLTSDSFVNGVIKIVSSTGTKVTSSKGQTYIRCDATAPSPTPTLIAWGTHVQNSGAITETAFEKAPLSAPELAVLTDKCSDINDNGSGHGLCSCGDESKTP
jgi:hypothetical protein